MFERIGKAVNVLLGRYEPIIPANDKMRSYIKLWNDIYKGKPNWLSDNVKTMGLGASIASELARLTTLEMKSEINGEEELNKIYQEEVIDRLREHTEYAAALGGIVMKPYINNRDELKVEFISALNFIPLDNELLSGVFIDRRDNYIRLEKHILDTDGTYHIENKAYESFDGITGKEVPLTVIPEWEHLEEQVIIKNLNKPLFAYFKVPNANIVNPKSPLGVSVYAKAVHLLEEADKQYSRILWEYEGSELALHVDINMLNNDDELAKGKDRLYVKVDAGEDGFYKVFNPEIRDESLFNGLNKLLQRIEFNCGLAYGTLSDMQLVNKTATEIKVSKQRSFSTVKDMQKSLEKTLRNLVDILMIYNDLYGIIDINTDEPEMSFEFDDSIVVDSETEQTILLQEVAAGIISKEEYLKRRYGVTEEQAKKMMPSDSVEVDENADTGIFVGNIREDNTED